MTPEQLAATGTYHGNNGKTLKKKDAEERLQPGTGQNPGKQGFKVAGSGFHRNRPASIRQLFLAPQFVPS